MSGDAGRACSAQIDVSLTLTWTCSRQLGIDACVERDLRGSGRCRGYVDVDLLEAGGFIHERARGPARRVLIKLDQPGLD